MQKNHSQRNHSQKKNKQKDKMNNSLKSYAKYSGIAFQMGAIIFLGTWGAYRLDNYFNFENHILTLILSPVSVLLAIYIAVKDFIK